MSTTTASTGSESAAEFLHSALSYPDHPSAVHVIETHISWVFLTDCHAYKLKKPVQFEFLNFSTPELRHRACLEEVRLNRRLARDIYIDVLPITQNSDGSLELSGDGRQIDWVVKMRRLPAESALVAILRENRLTPEVAEAIAQFLADFYSRLLPKPLNSDDYRRRLDRHIRANGVALLDSLPAERTRVRRIQTAQLRYLNVQAKLIDDRVVAGRIVDGHGDLRPEHIYVAGGPNVIDCLEFSEELRTVDIADDLCFLYMECERLDHGELGEFVLARYQRASGDAVPESLLSFYRCYRAMMRAKVALLRSQQHSSPGPPHIDEHIRQYFDLADRYAPQLGLPCVLIVGGLMGTGKSTLARKLADAFNMELLSTDHIRRSMFGRSELPAGYGEANYRPDMRSRVYDALLGQASEILESGQSVILDGTFVTCGLRDRVYDLASRYHAVPLLVQCTCARQMAYARILARAESGQGESEARAELYDLQARELEPAWSDEPAIIVDTTQAMSQQLQAVYSELRRSLFI